MIYSKRKIKQILNITNTKERETYEHKKIKEKGQKEHRKTRAK